MVYYGLVRVQHRKQSDLRAARRISRGGLFRSRTSLAYRQPGGSELATASSNRSPRFASISNGADTVYIMTTTAIGGDTNGGQGAIQVIDVSNAQNAQALQQSSSRRRLR